MFLKTDNESVSNADAIFSKLRGEDDHKRENGAV
jgi:hypothetical protein